MRGTGNVEADKCPRAMFLPAVLDTSVSMDAWKCRCNMEPCKTLYSETPPGAPWTYRVSRSSLFQTIARPLRDLYPYTRPCETPAGVAAPTASRTASSATPPFRPRSFSQLLAGAACLDRTSLHAVKLIDFQGTYRFMSTFLSINKVGPEPIVTG